MSNTWHSVPTNEIVRRAQRGEGEAQCYLGKAYFEGMRGFKTNFVEGRRWLLKSAEQNVAQAQNTLGWNAAYGIGVATNFVEARRWFQQAADLGFPQGEVNLARIYRYGNGVPPDWDLAVGLYRRAVRHGLTVAKSELGFLLSDQPNLGPSERQDGLKLLREAAEEGEVFAQNRLGGIYWKGRGVETDLALAQQWFFRAARQGSTKAMENIIRLATEQEDITIFSNLFPIVLQYAKSGSAHAQYLAGDLYSGGLGVARSETNALAWYERSAAQDYGGALQAIATHYNNSGPHEDRKKAFLYYQRAAAKGLRDSMGHVAELLLSGEAGITNEARGIVALKTAADAESIWAQEELAKRYRSGRGVPTNVLLAVHWFNAVMTNRSWIGPQRTVGMTLGIMYATGDGVPRDDREAYRWFKEAAEYEGRDAMDSLGYCHALGRGTFQDDALAVRWFRAAGGEDDRDDVTRFYPAVANLGVMYALGRGGLERDLRKAVSLLESASRFPGVLMCTVPHAETALAICLYEGNGTERNVERALKLFRQAADTGNPQAQLHAGMLLLRGEGAPKDLSAAFAYFEAAVGNNEPGAAAWRARAANELTAAQQTEAAAKGQSIAKSPPRCFRTHLHQTWNQGLRLPNSAVTVQ